MKSFFKALNASGVGHLLLGICSIILVILIIAGCTTYSQKKAAKDEASRDMLNMANSLQAEAVNTGGFALMAIPGPGSTIITNFTMEKSILGTPLMNIGEIKAKTEFFNNPKEIRLLDADGHVVDEFEFGQTVQPGDLVIAWYVDPTSIHPGKYPKSFLGTLPRYWNPDTGFAVSIVHSVVEKP